MDSMPLIVFDFLSVNDLKAGGNGSARDSERAVAFIMDSSHLLGIVNNEYVLERRNKEQNSRYSYKGSQSSTRCGHPIFRSPPLFFLIFLIIFFSFSLFSPTSQKVVKIDGRS